MSTTFITIEFPFSGGMDWKDASRITRALDECPHVAVNDDPDNAIAETSTVTDALIYDEGILVHNTKVEAEEAEQLAAEIRSNLAELLPGDLHEVTVRTVNE